MLTKEQLVEMDGRREHALRAAILSRDALIKRQSDEIDRLTAEVARLARGGDRSGPPSA
jgi:hypothetical protein